MTDKDLGRDPSDPKVPPASLEIQPALEATYSLHAGPFTALPKEHLEDSSLSILFGARTQFRSAGRVQAPTWAMGLSAGTTYKENGHPVGCEKQHLQSR